MPELTPTQAGHIASNVYFTLKGWSAYQAESDPNKKVAPVAAMEDQGVIAREVTGVGKHSVGNANMGTATIQRTFTGDTGLGAGMKKTSGFGYLMKHEGDVIIATRGTRPEMGLEDILTDLRFAPSGVMPGAGPVHKGFLDTFNSVLPTLIEHNATIRSAGTVHCVGHSLGAAIANLVAFHLANQGLSVKLYTFGAPRVGLYMSYPSIMNRVVGAGNMYRVSHTLDPITMIPTFPFAHVLEDDDAAGNIQLDSPAKGAPWGWMENHDIGKYIQDTLNKDWAQMKAESIASCWEDRLWNDFWESDGGVVKKAGGMIVAASSWAVMKLLRTLLNYLAAEFTLKVATPLDLICQLIYQGAQLVSKLGAKVREWVAMACEYVGVKLKQGAEITKTLLSYLLNRLMSAIVTSSRRCLEHIQRNGHLYAGALTGGLAGAVASAVFL